MRLAGVQVLVDVPLFHLDRPFTYRVPEALQGQVHLGSRVKVPFGGRRRVGMGMRLKSHRPPDPSGRRDAAARAAGGRILTST